MVTARGRSIRAAFRVQQYNHVKRGSHTLPTNERASQLLCNKAACNDRDEHAC